TTVGEVAESLGVSPGLLTREADPALPLASAGLLSGAIVPPLAADEPAPGTVRLEVIGGPFAGAAIPIERGQTLTLGTGESDDVRIADPSLAPAHLTVQTAFGGPGDPLLATVTPAPGAV